MKTTLKRGVGRGAHVNGNGRAVFPPGAISPITRYRQPPPSGTSGIGLISRILVVTLLVFVSIGAALAGSAYLWFHQSVADIQASTPDVKRAQKQLDVTLPGHAAIALIVGYDHRSGVESGLDSRSDTMMLLRADPDTKTISMLSFPRDLIVDIHCPAKPGQAPPAVTRERINGAYSRCGSGGSLETVKHLTGLPVNYLITVNFHGFKQIVDTLGGVWMDVDRRYYNKNVGTSATNFADIDLQPGYQRLNATQALEFVRYRHTDSDLYRLARQQQFVRAFKEQVAQNHSTADLVTKLPGLVSAITHNVEVGVGGNSPLKGSTVISYALFAATLPPGHFFQTKIQNVTGYSELSAPQADIAKAVDEFQSPDVQAPGVANAVALGRRIRAKAPPASATTVTVLNGNGVPGAAGNASFQLAQRGYRVLDPANGAQGNAPSQAYFHTKVYSDPRQPRSKPAAQALAALMQPADVEALPADPQIRALDPGSMLVVVVGQTFHNRIAPLPVRVVPKKQPAYVRFDRGPGQELLRPLVGRVPFKVMLPTILERSSVPDTLPSDKPVRMYWIKNDKKAIRLVFRNGAGEFWGIQETNWNDAPVLGDKSFHHVLGGRQFDFYYSGAHLHMVALRANGATYWVVNTLLDSLSNETMIAIAKGLKPLTTGK